MSWRSAFRPPHDGPGRDAMLPTSMVGTTGQATQANDSEPSDIDPQGRLNSVLLIDGEGTAREQLAAALFSEGFSVVTSPLGDEALAFVRRQRFLSVVCDIALSDMSGFEFARRLRDIAPSLPVIMTTSDPVFDLAVVAMRLGVHDMLCKPVEVEVLVERLRKRAHSESLQHELRQLEDNRRSDAPKVERLLIGKSPAMQHVFYVLENAAESDVTVLISGESGTGKELAARAIHNASARATGPFVALNCAAVPETLLESELFGHAKGAFTDAKNTRTGLFVQADGGTVLLDEIGEMPLGMQAKLLRVLQERTLRPVGSDREVGFDVRIITATNRYLEAAVHEGRFREDLFYRINVLSLVMPPLRSRGEDVLLLAHEFLAQAAARTRKAVEGFTGESAELLLGYGWPGNVRELQNAIERAVALSKQKYLTVDDFPTRIREAYAGTHGPNSLLSHSERVAAQIPDKTELLPLEEVERRHVLHVMEATSGNLAMAARLLGLDRKTLYRKLDKWGVTRTR